MIQLDGFLKRSGRDRDSFEGSKEMFAYASVLSISMIVVSVTLALGNLAHRLAFRVGNDNAVYDKYADVNLFSFNFELEIVDKATWLICLLIGCVVLFFGLTQKWHVWFSCLASKNLYLVGIFVMSISVLIVSPVYDDLIGVLWFGFGDRVFLVAVIVLQSMYERHTQNLF